jgi:uncharacterized protein YjeT (DUF2065 family)
MELSIFIAKIYGIVMTTMGLGLLLNIDYYKKVFADMMKDTTCIFMGGLLAITIGTVILLTHNVWEWSWVVLITLFGVLGVVKGFLLLVFPKSLRFFESWFKSKNFLIATGFGSLVLGLVITYFGFFA